MKRHWLLAVGLLLGLAAGVLVYQSMQMAPVVTAARPLDVGDRLSPGDLSVREVNPAARPAGVLTSLDAAVGAFATGPIPAGQYIVSGQLADSRRAALLAHAASIPPGHALIAIPVDATQALGGVVPPSQVVDVLVASPDPAADRTLSGSVPQQVEVLGRGVLLVELRSDRGEVLQGPADDDSLARRASVRIGAAVLAVPAADVPRYVARIPTGTFVLSQRLDVSTSSASVGQHQTVQGRP
ncbi:MAG: Flp pilus assembly protein CpaB [Chloroflexi bacterium]|nr:Flp pilus assembly protein CpaB [Chloroflexota bacterium]MCY4111881.1 Flp pilus assembly protein CpaB [Chloroflexota bacterium]